MKDYIIDRVMDIADCIIKEGLTVRQAGKKFNVSKSTVHADVSERLKKIDISIYKEVKAVLDFNFSMRHLRGGESTRQKYKEEDNT